MGVLAAVLSTASVDAVSEVSTACNDCGEGGETLTECVLFVVEVSSISTWSLTTNSLMFIWLSCFFFLAELFHRNK